MFLGASVNHDVKCCALGHRLEPAFDVRSVLHHLTGGVDLTQIDGIGAYTALKLVAEIGTEMQQAN